MNRAFLSHSSKDKGLVRKIANVMGDHCVFDEMTFEAGMPTLIEIMEGIQHSDLFVLFISNDALNSEWVQKEILQAEKISADNLTRILPIIIDKNISYKDSRIPNWLRDSYNIQWIKNESVILNIIFNRLRKLLIRDNEIGNLTNGLFVGRNEELGIFERDLNNLDMWTPTYIVAYNYISGIGRRTFLKNALRRENILEKVEEPKYVALDNYKSIENFIYQLATINGTEEAFDTDLSRLSMVEKIDLATEIIESFVKARQLIFIIDDGGIIMPNHHIAPWFDSIVKKETFKNRLVFCLVSHYRPQHQFGEKFGLYYNIKELSRDETRILFLKLLEINNITGISREHKVKFLEVLTGVPDQINYAIELLKSEPRYALTHIDDIRNYSDHYLSNILSKFAADSLTFQMILFLSKEDVMSYNIIYEIFGNKDDIYESIRQLEDYSCVSDMFDGAYIRLNPALRDFVHRSKLSLGEEWDMRYKKLITKYERNNLDSLIREDYSKFMLVLNELVREGKEIPSKYFMPSLLLSAIIKEYNNANYDVVIKMCEKLLQYTNYDDNIIWTTRYRLTMAYARVGNEQEFRRNVVFFKASNRADYHFLNGFFYRNLGKYRYALNEIDRALEKYPEHKVSLREKVNILIGLSEFDNALELAKKNYYSKPDDIIHAHSYFKALICSSKLNREEHIDILNNLISNVENSADSRGDHLARCMRGEYEYYIQHDLETAELTLQEACRLAPNRSYALKALSRIYEKENLKDKKMSVDIQLKKM